MKAFSYSLASCALVGVLGALVSVACADSSRYPAHFYPQRVQAELRDAFLDAFSKNRPLAVPRVTEEVADSDPVLKDVWLGNEPELSASMDRVQLLFEMPPLHEGATKDSFLLDIDFRSEKFEPTVVVRSSRPSVAKTEGGVRMFLKGDKARRTLLRGLNKASVIIALPETLSDAVKGVLLCPLDPIHASNQEIAVGLTPTLSDTGFRPVSARVSVAASVKGKLLSGLRPGVARANIASSPGIPNEHLHFDETYSKDPHVDVVYQGDAMTAPIPFSADGIFLQAISAELELQNGGGYTRSSTLTEKLEIAPVERDFEFSVIALKRDFKINSRSCLLLLRSSEIKQVYTKSDSKAP